MLNHHATRLRLMMECHANVDIVALKTEGLFRISGEQDVVHHIRNLFDAAVQDNVALESFEVHDVASALKLFLRQLPDPLLTRRLFQPLVDVSSTNQPACRILGFIRFD